VARGGLTRSLAATGVLRRLVWTGLHPACAGDLSATGSRVARQADESGLSAPQRVQVCMRRSSPRPALAEAPVCAAIGARAQSTHA